MAEAALGVYWGQPPVKFGWIPCDCVNDGWYVHEPDCERGKMVEASLNEEKYCINCGHPKTLADEDLEKYGFIVQECWVEDYGEDGPYAVKLRHKW